MLKRYEIFLCIFALSLFYCTSPALSQNYPKTMDVVAPETVFPSSDENGVDLATGGRTITGPALVIGNPTHGGIDYRPAIAGWAINALYLSGNPNCYSCNINGFIGQSNLTAMLTRGGHLYERSNTLPATITAGGKIAHFWSSTDTAHYIEYTPVVGRELTFSTTDIINTMTSDGINYLPISQILGTYTFKDTDGTKYLFTAGNFTSYPNCTYPCSDSTPVSQIIKSNGETLKYYYQYTPATSLYKFPQYKLISVVSNSGYMIKFQWGTFNMGGVSNTTYWNSGNLAVAVNTAVDACNPIAYTCNLTHVWPMMYSNGLSITDSAGGVTKIANSNYLPGNVPATTVITRPNGRVETFNFDGQYAELGGAYPAACAALAQYGPLVVPCPFQHLTSYNNGINTWNYSISYGTKAGSEGNYITTTIQRTKPTGEVRTTMSIPSGQLISSVDELSRTTTISVDEPLKPNEGRVQSIRLPEGNSISFVYDARGNMTQQTVVPKAGSGLENIITNITYPTTCVNWSMCNKPISVKDPKGNVTSYTYDPIHGGVLTETMPISSNGIVPIKRYTYAQLYAWLSNGVGGYMPASNPVWMLTQMRTCRATATVGNACTGGTADEVVTNYYYGPQSGPNNLELRGVSVIADGATLNTCYAYDATGNKISETKPLGGVSTCP